MTFNRKNKLQQASQSKKLISKKKNYQNKLKKNKISEPLFAYIFQKSRIEDENWDFRKANTKEYTHCFHPYPAMMIPQVARRILELFGKNSKLLFDPYCGTGTSLVEANIRGINAVGTDLNPLARLIAKAKTTKLDIQVLDLFLQDFMNLFFSINFKIEKLKSLIIPNIFNIDFWFAKDVQQKLAVLLQYIENINDTTIKNFFKVAFSETVREVSFVKQGEFKLVREKNLNNKQDLDVFGIMITKLSRNKQGLIEFIKSCKNDSSTLIYDFNTVDLIPQNKLDENSVDIIVTSPPYGDSRTTVAYGQFSRLSNEWLGFKEANQIDNNLMGGKKRKHNHVFKCDLLNDIIYSIQKQDKERARDVISFYEDYEKSIINISSVIKKKGFVCYVVGNRTVKGVKITTDEITKEMFKENGFTYIETIARNIPNKRMPLKNSPSNIVGETASTIKNEYIVICQKK